MIGPGLEEQTMRLDMGNGIQTGGVPGDCLQSLKSKKQHAFIGHKEISVVTQQIRQNWWLNLHVRHAETWLIDSDDDCSLLTFTPP